MFIPGLSCSQNTKEISDQIVNDYYASSPQQGTSGSSCTPIRLLSFCLQSTQASEASFE